MLALPFLGKLFRDGAIGATGCLLVLLLFAVIIAISALWWGLLLGLIAWNHILVPLIWTSHHAVVIHRLKFWGAMGIGLIASFVLG